MNGSVAAFDLDPIAVVVFLDAEASEVLPAGEDSTTGDRGEAGGGVAPFDAGSPGNAHPDAVAKMIALKRFILYGSS